MRQMIDNPYGGRPVKEWIGKKSTSMPPPGVKQRIFDRAKGVCVLSGMKIGKKKWDAHHVKRLADGGENRERNIAPALRDAHKEHSIEENTRMKKADRQRRADIGAVAETVKKIESRGFDKHEHKSKIGGEKIAKEPVRGLPEIARRYGMKE